MLTFEVKDMDECDGAIAIVKAVMVLDNEAVVRIDMARHSVEVEQALATADEFRYAIMGAGFSSALLAAERRAWPEGIGAAAPRETSKQPPKIPFDGEEHDFRPASNERDALPAGDSPRQR